MTEDRELASGIVYKHYSFTNFNQNIYAIEIDMNNPKVTFETVMADEICPNPNGNNNSNNGKILRETLSETCVRRRGEGRNIVVGINTGFSILTTASPEECILKKENLYSSIIRMCVPL